MQTCMLRMFLMRSPMRSILFSRFEICHAPISMVYWMCDAAELPQTALHYESKLVTQKSQALWICLADSPC
ncbi:unnamed protein product [Amoebophrya sp. A120]|nr:unnamed protein product [Amoebophrya sp. A120]|eukprot:GSA120T00009227001.1